MELIKGGSHLEAGPRRALRGNDAEASAATQRSLKRTGSSTSQRCKTPVEEIDRKAQQIAGMQSSDQVTPKSSRCHLNYEMRNPIDARI
eukprot:3252516-Pleurochrysis_carterae.AAC.6